MPINRATLIRISTIDKCLQNHYRRWTINDLLTPVPMRWRNLKGEVIQ